MGWLLDPSSKQIERKLRTPRNRDVVVAHDGNASVRVKGKMPTKHDESGTNVQANKQLRHHALCGRPRDHRPGHADSRGHHQGELTWLINPTTNGRMCSTEHPRPTL
jgi:hypothetical protein